MTANSRNIAIFWGVFHKVSVTIPKIPHTLDEVPGYSAALSYLYDRIDYEKIGATPYTLGYYRLDRLRKLLDALGQPHLQYPILHIAGTKGKGTTATLLAAALLASGKRTGLYTSPHLLRLEERIQVDGAACSPEQLIALTDMVRTAAADLEAGGEGRATFFELTTAMGLLHFAQQEAQAVVLEVGLGGRLDSTNVCTPIVSIITSISLDHQTQLGSTLDAIAREKAGIIKPGVPVVCTARSPEARAAIADVATAQRAPIEFIDSDFYVTWTPLRDAVASQATGHPATIHPATVYPAAGGGNESSAPAIDGAWVDFQLGPADCALAPAEMERRNHGSPKLDLGKCLPGSNTDLAGTDTDLTGRWQTCLLGRHQADNIAAVLATLRLLQQQGWQLPRAALQQALAVAQPPARLQIVSRQPLAIIDSAHNPASVAAGLAALNDHFPDCPVTVVFAASRDKDWGQMLELLAARANRLILTAYQKNPRGLPIAELRHRAEQLLIGTAPRPGAQLKIETIDTPAAAWSHACQTAPAGQIIYSTGSFFLAAEIMSGDSSSS